MDEERAGNLSFDLETINDTAMSSSKRERLSTFLPFELQSNIKLFGNFSTDDMASTSLYASHGDARKRTKLEFATFCTGSSYIGDFNKIGMTGKGMYRYPHGVVYEGDFNKNGEFHGAGILRYPNGHNVEGIWRNGKMVKNPILVAADNTLYRSDYCKMPDRRFEIETQQYLAPTPNEFLTNRPNPPREIPPHCYDAGEGFYDPKRNVLLKYTDLSVLTQVPEVSGESENKQKLLSLSMSQKTLLDRMITLKTESTAHIVSNLPLFLAANWIVNNCRKAEDEPVGYKPRLYETWTAGIKMAEEEVQPTESNHSISDIDNIVDALNRMEGGLQDQTPVTSKFYSFIRCSEHESVCSDGGSLLALRDMFFRQLMKHCIIKKAKVHWTKQKLKARLSSDSKRSKPRVITFNTNTSKSTHHAES